MVHRPEAGQRLTLDEALALIARYEPLDLGTESVALTGLRGRVLASPIVAPFAVPPADNSAVDGYAFRHADLGPGDTAFMLAGTAAAGRPFSGALPPSAAIRIFTGALIPDGADTVAMQEDVRKEEGRVIVAPGLVAGANRRRAGEDIAAGSTVLCPGRRLGAAEIGLLAALGFSDVPVRHRLSVAVFSTGDELTEPGAERRDGQIYDSNRPVLRALLESLGIAVTDLGILPDDRVRITAALEGAAKGHDTIVSSAGMSVGDEDHVRPAVAALGALDFWNLAIKPGPPIAVGRVRDTPFFGLPGNPAALVVTFLMIVRPALLRLAGADETPPRRTKVRLGKPLHKKAGRREFVRARLEPADDGGWIAMPFGRHGSGILSSIVESDGLLELPEALGGLGEGAEIAFLSFRELGL